MSPTGRGREWLISGKSVADAMRVRNAQSWVNGGADSQGGLEGSKKNMRSGGFKLHPSIESDIRFWGVFLWINGRHCWRSHSVCGSGEGMCEVT
ncbi:hypothetical protein QG37_07512 [Candidozyma auris]|nr:hypothetical protein QG37_07512 [[Candida] auris]